MGSFGAYYSGPPVEVRLEDFARASCRRCREPILAAPGDPAAYELVISPEPGDASVGVRRHECRYGLFDRGRF